MRIAIDARELIVKPTGVGRYLSELLRAWGRLPAAAAHEFVLCLHEPFEPPAEGPARCTVAVAPGHGTRWQQFALPRIVRNAGAQVLLAPAYSGPVAPGVPMVVAVHDVSFLAHPEWFGWKEGLRLRQLTRWSARRAARIVACSDFSKREIVRRLRLSPSKVDVVYLGTSSLAGRTDSSGPSAGPSRPALPTSDERLVLYVGSIFARRHLPELIEGFSTLSRRDTALRLEIVGENRSRPFVDVDRLIAESPASPQIRARSYVEDDDLAGLYRRASAFVFLSDYEGFGLTPLEALNAGVPIVVLDTEVSREIYGPAAIYVQEPGPQLIAAALERALYDQADRSRLLEAAPAVVQRYSWDECARRTLQILLASAGSPR